MGGTGYCRLSTFKCGDAVARGQPQMKLMVSLKADKGRKVLHINPGHGSSAG